MFVPPHQKRQIQIIINLGNYFLLEKIYESIEIIGTYLYVGLKLIITLHELIIGMAAWRCSF